jgi:hypothetical protein
MRYASSVDAKKITLSVGSKQLAAAKRIARRDGVSLSAVFIHALERELEADERREALANFVKDLPPLTPKRKRDIRAAWERKPSTRSAKRQAA